MEQYKTVVGTVEAGGDGGEVTAAGERRRQGGRPNAAAG